MLNIDLFQQHVCDFSRYYNRDISQNPIALRAWYDYLADNLTDEELIPALKKAIQTFQFMPSPQKLLEVFRGASDTDALVAWNSTLLEARNGNRGDRQTDLAPETKIALLKIGGVSAVGRADEWGLKALRERFFVEFKSVAIAGNANLLLSEAQKQPPPEHFAPVIPEQKMTFIRRKA